MMADWKTRAVADLASLPLMMGAVPVLAQQPTVASLPEPSPVTIGTVVPGSPARPQMNSGGIHLIADAAPATRSTEAKTQAPAPESKNGAPAAPEKGSDWGSLVAGLLFFLIPLSSLFGVPTWLAMRNLRAMDDVTQQAKSKMH
jgi:hypothetical protein